MCVTRADTKAAYQPANDDQPRDRGRRREEEEWDGGIIDLSTSDRAVAVVV